MLLAIIALAVGVALGYLISKVRSSKEITEFKEQLATAQSDLTSAASQVNVLTWQLNSQRADTSKA